MALSLSLLDRVADALSTCVVDDVHVGGRFAPQLASTINLVRKTIVRIAADGGSIPRHPKHGAHGAVDGYPSTARQTDTTNGHSTQQMLSPTQGKTLRLKVHPELAGQLYSNSQHGTHSGRAAQIETELPTQSIPGTTVNPLTDHDPLYGIEPQYYNAANPAYTLMPPAGLWPPNETSRSSAFAMADEFMDVPEQSGLDDILCMDWFALPMDRLFPYSGQEVTTGSYGTDIGGMDMLDVLLMNSDGGVGGEGTAQIGGSGPWTGTGNG